jgi:hypothetical protein
VLKKVVSRHLKYFAFLILPFALAPTAHGQEFPPLWPNAQEIEEFLKEADVVDRKDLGTGVTKPEKVTLEWKGETRYAVFKNIDKEHDTYRGEVAAYELDKLLGMGMVPPTVARRIGGRKGCLQLWVTGKTMEKLEGIPEDVERWRRQVSMMWLFDDLIANIDRHLNNAMVTPDGRLVLIDNSKTFRGYRKLLNDLNANGIGTHAKFWGVPYDADRVRWPTSYRPEVVERLRSVSEKEIKNAIKKYIWGYNQKLVLKRRELILARLDGMETAESPTN